MSPDAFRPTLLVLSAPTGGGKTTIGRRIVEADGAIRFSVSHTTRAPRPGEADGVDYHFVSEQTFRAMADGGQFLEWAEVHGKFYGTHRGELDRAREGRWDLLLDIDVQGGLQVKKSDPSAVLVFILPPSLEVMLQRVGNRAEEPGFDLRRRMVTAERELELAEAYDYNILNEDLDVAVGQVRRILEASRLRAAGRVAAARRLRDGISTWLRGSYVRGG